MKNTKKLLSVIAAIVTALSLAACGSNYANYSYDSGSSMSSLSKSTGFSEYGEYVSDEYYSDESYYSEAVTEDVNGSGTIDGSLTSESYDDSARKLIKNYNLDVETEDFDDFLAALEARVDSMSGYIESLETYNGSSYGSYRSKRYSSVTVRIPKDKADEFVNFVGESANITDKSLSVEDVTLTYVDLESRKETYEIEQERLLALLEKAESIDDIITIESRLSEVRYKLESMASQLRTYDNLVDYSTVYIYISEVETYTEPEPVSYGERVAQSFKNGLENVGEDFENFFVNFMGALPGIVVFIVFAAIIVLIIRALVKHGKKKKAAKAEKRANEMMEAAEAKAREKANNAEQF